MDTNANNMLENVLSNRENIHDMHYTEKKHARYCARLDVKKICVICKHIQNMQINMLNNVYINMYNIHHMKKNMQKKKQIYQGLCKVC